MPLQVAARESAAAASAVKAQAAAESALQGVLCESRRWASDAKALQALLQAQQGSKGDVRVGSAATYAELGTLLVD
jgi:hypothetical protein